MCENLIVVVRGGLVENVYDGADEVAYWVIDYDSVDDCGACPVCHQQTEFEKYADVPLIEDVCPNCGVNYKDMLPHEIAEKWENLLTERGKGWDEYTAPEPAPGSEKVDVIASGYEWTCPKCDTLNNEIEYREFYTCAECGLLVYTEPPMHAGEKDAF